MRQNGRDQLPPIANRNFNFAAKVFMKKFSKDLIQYFQLLLITANYWSLRQSGRNYFYTKLIGITSVLLFCYLLFLSYYFLIASLCLLYRCLPICMYCSNAISLRPLIIYYVRITLTLLTSLFILIVFITASCTRYQRV